MAVAEAFFVGRNRGHNLALLAHLTRCLRPPHAALLTRKGLSFLRLVEPCHVWYGFVVHTQFISPLLLLRPLFAFRWTRARWRYVHRLASISGRRITSESPAAWHLAALYWRQDPSILVCHVVYFIFGGVVGVGAWLSLLFLIYVCFSFELDRLWIVAVIYVGDAWGTYVEITLVVSVIGIIILVVVWAATCVYVHVRTRHARTLKPSVRGFCSVEQGRYIFMGFDVALFSCVYFWGCGYCALFELLRTASIGWGLPLLVADLAYICYAAPALLVHFFIFCVIIFLALLLLIINLLLIVRLLYARW